MVKLQFYLLPWSLQYWFHLWWFLSVSNQSWVRRGYQPFVRQNLLTLAVHWNTVVLFFVTCSFSHSFIREIGSDDVLTKELKYFWFIWSDFSINFESFVPLFFQHPESSLKSWLKHTTTIKIWQFHTDKIPWDWRESNANFHIQTRQGTQRILAWCFEYDKTFTNFCGPSCRFRCTVRSLPYAIVN